MSLSKIKNQINQDFNLNFIQDKLNPLPCFNYSLAFQNFRVNHFCLKLNSGPELFMQQVPLDLQILINKVLKYCRLNGLPINDRYLFLTVDNNPTKSGQSQRTGGWHIDGFQGAEVPLKQHADFQFIWSNCWPTEFVSQNFNLTNFNENKTNLFKLLGSQIDQSKVFNLSTHKIYLMTPYMVHQSPIIPESTTERLFIRIAFSKVPVTSVKMTLNPEVSYNYPIHSTSGEIPHYLK